MSTDIFYTGGKKAHKTDVRHNTTIKRQVNTKQRNRNRQTPWKTFLDEFLLTRFFYKQHVYKQHQAETGKNQARTKQETDRTFAI